MIWDRKFYLIPGSNYRIIRKGTSILQVYFDRIVYHPAKLYPARYMHLDYAWRFVCVSWFVCLYPLNVNTAEPIGPMFGTSPTRPQGSFMDVQNYKHFFKFSLNFENTRKNVNPFIIVLSKRNAKRLSKNLNLN